jgi:uncharacterized membrane protein
MSRYELLKFLHVAAVVIWLGAGFLIAVLVYGAERAGDRQRQFGYYRDVAWLSPRLFIPSSLATFILGILVALDGDWGFDQLWIVIGLVGYAVSFLLGILYFRPESQTIGALVEEHGPEHAEIERRTRRLNGIERVQLLILFLVVADMVVKPTGDDTGFLVVSAALLALAIAAAARSLRPSARVG